MQKKTNNLSLSLSLSFSFFFFSFSLLENKSKTKGLGNLITKHSMFMFGVKWKSFQANESDTILHEYSSTIESCERLW